MLAGYFLATSVSGTGRAHRVEWNVPNYQGVFLRGYGVAKPAITMARLVTGAQG